MNRKDTGILGERLAGDFLKERGYDIIEYNYRCPGGEIDIVARHGDYLVFVEVKTRKSLRFGSPEESVTPAKKKRIVASAAHYYQDHQALPELWRIDFVAVELDRSSKPSRVELIENAINLF